VRLWARNLIRVTSFRAFVANHEDGSIPNRIEELPFEILGEGNVTIRVQWSSINYKDTLAADARGRVARISPLIPGVDLAGEVVESDSATVTVGDNVIVHGYDLGVAHHGGYATYARVPDNWIVPLPSDLSARDAMVVGTAGFTAALSVVALEDHGLTPGGGEVLVLGATGGVGSIALSILASHGYKLVAVTGKPDHTQLLLDLGATEVISRDEVSMDGKPLERERWGGCVDPVGGKSLEYAIRTLRYGAAVASCGQIGGTEFTASIFPFILRGITHFGIDSVKTPIERRREVWRRIGDEFKTGSYPTVAVREVALHDVGSFLAASVNGSAVGRTIVNVSGE